jgi:hypothetical protein
MRTHGGLFFADELSNSCVEQGGKIIWMIDSRPIQVAPIITLRKEESSKRPVLADSQDGDSWEHFFHGKQDFCQLTALQ